MKKVYLFSAFIFCLLAESKAQFVNAIGITAGVSAGNQKFFFREPVSISRKNYTFGFNASIFGELMSRDYVRWITEIQYNQKGSIDKQPDANFPNKLQIISWNNYLKIRYELYSVIPYILIGPRLDYTLTQSTTSPQITGPFLPLHVSAAVGAGAELISYSNFKVFIEGFYNPDIMPAYISPDLHVMNKNFELRLGLKYQFGGQRESCNTPTYVE